MTLNAVKTIIHKFEKTGSLDIAPGRGRRATALAIVKEVGIATAEATARSSNATVSGSSIVRTLDIPWAWATVRMILRKIIKLYPYKMNFVQQLKQQDHSAHLDFALNFLARMQVDKYWPSHNLWIDEAHFHLDGAVNTHNCRIHESSCRATATVTFLIRDGMMWIYREFHFAPVLLRGSHNERVC